MPKDESVTVEERAISVKICDRVPYYKSHLDDPMRYCAFCDKIVDGLRAAVEARDVEWCKMLGFSEAGAHGNTPEFMRRELESLHDEPDTAVAVHAAVEAQKAKLKPWLQHKRDCGKCSDPQCGDSTWDHYCTETSECTCGFAAAIRSQ